MKKSAFAALLLGLVPSSSQAVTFTFDTTITSRIGTLGDLFNSSGTGTLTFTPQTIDAATSQFGYSSVYEALPYSVTLELDGRTINLIDSFAQQLTYDRHGILVQDLPSDAITYDLFEAAGYSQAGAVLSGEQTHTYIQWFGRADTLNDTELSESNLEDIALDPVEAIFQINGGGGDGQLRGSITNLREVDAAVPEPASWAMFIGGFGLVGSAMRRKRVAISFA